MRRGLPDTVTDAQLEQGWYDDLWKGTYPRFCCTECQFDSFYLGVMQVHVFELHQRKQLLEAAAREGQQTRPARATLFDARGNQIESVPVVHRPGDPIEDRTDD